MNGLFFFFLACAAAADDTRAELEHCVSEYNSLLSQCQSEINKANQEISRLHDTAKNAFSEVERLKEVELFSWAAIREHVEHFVPALKGRRLIPEGIWEKIANFIETEVKPKISESGRMGFLKTAPVENFLLFSALSLWMCWWVLKVVQWATRGGRRGGVACCPFSGK